MQTSNTIYKWLQPKSRDRDLARKEYILNILLIGAIVLSFLAVVSNFITKLTYLWAGQKYPGTSDGIMLVVFIFYLLSYPLSRAGKFQWVIYIFLSIYFLGASYTAYIWGANAPSSLLIYAMVIIMSGILVSSKFAFFATIIISITQFTIVVLQQEKMIPINTFWKQTNPHVGDWLIYTAIFLIIAVVSWLSVKELEKALKRAHRSEAALRRQRDRLEIMVEKRTQQLKLIQAEKLAQVYRFAEVGKSASGLFHDLVNPLTIVSLNLNKLSKDKSIKGEQIYETEEVLKRAILGTKRLENFITAARKQIQNQEIKKRFSVKDEITQAIQMLEPRSKKGKVQVIPEFISRVQMFGNPIKFNQLVTNLISNAVDSYERIKKRPKIVKVRVKKNKNNIILEVQDYGEGIDEQNLQKIFEPLFTTKSFEKGTGIGLSICKKIIEDDFKGQIKVISEKGQGSTFTTEFPA